MHAPLHRIACCRCGDLCFTVQVFVDELTCIGCRNCTNVCPNTYQMEPDFGRARAMAQKADNEEMLQESLDCCPVDCIHWVGNLDWASMLAACIVYACMMNKALLLQLLSECGDILPPALHHMLPPNPGLASILKDAFGMKAWCCNLSGDCPGDCAAAVFVGELHEQAGAHKCAPAQHPWRQQRGCQCLSGESVFTAPLSCCSVQKPLL